MCALIKDYEKYIFFSQLCLSSWLLSFKHFLAPLFNFIAFASFEAVSSFVKGCRRVAVICFVIVYLSFLTSWMAVVNPTDNPKSVRNRYVIEALVVISCCCCYFFLFHTFLLVLGILSYGLIGYLPFFSVAQYTVHARSIPPYSLYGKATIILYKSVQNKIPPYFQYKELPCISYSYTPSVASKIFNYKASLQQLDFQGLS